MRSYMKNLHNFYPFAFTGKKTPYLSFRHGVGGKLGEGRGTFPLQKRSMRINFSLIYREKRWESIGNPGVLGQRIVQGLGKRDYGKLDVIQIPETFLNKPLVNANAHLKWLLYSGLFVLLKQKLRLHGDQVEIIGSDCGVRL
jgi:hypothetical protein